jgi:predicted RNA-binding protein YlxR (DUF448 family)
MAGFPDSQKPLQAHAQAVTPPQRTCIGCRRREDQAVLLRLAIEEVDGVPTVVVDPARRRPGRGAWMHREPDCMELALKRHAFGRAFRATVDSSTVADQFRADDEAATAAGPVTQTVQPESGSEN